MEELPGEGHRLLRLEKVVETATPSGDKVKTRGTRHGEIMRGDQESAGKLGERSEALATSEIPLKYDRVGADAVVSPLKLADEPVAVEDWIHGDDVHGPLEIAPRPTVADLPGQHFADAPAQHQEIELRGITAVGVRREAGE